MPEGDTIFRTAVTLGQVLTGHVLTGFHAPSLGGGQPSQGTTITSVEAKGKHLLIHFMDGPVLHTHMGMHGSWHIYRHGEPWWRSATRARAAVETAEMVAVCFDPSVAELLDATELERHPQLAALGPDLCLPDADIDEVVRRLGALDPSTPVGVALLDQRVAAGVGNVYKSEVSHACSVNPFTQVGDLDPSTRRSLFVTASSLLRQNLSGGPRRTIPQGLAVYERGGRPCPACRATILHRRQGEAGRSTWWCPRCQPSVPGAVGAPGT